MIARLYDLISRFTAGYVNKTRWRLVSVLIEWWLCNLPFNFLFLKKKKKQFLLHSYQDIIKYRYNSPLNNLYFYFIMKYYHSSTIFLRFSFPLTQFRSLQGKNLFIPQHWEHLATEAKVANASLTLTWSTSFHPVGPSLSFTPSLLTFPSKGGNLPLPWRLCSNLSSISPRSFPLSLSPSSLSSPLLFRTHDLPDSV